MPAVVQRIVERNLQDVFERAPYVLVRLDRAPTPTFHLGVAEYFDHRFPRLFVFGTFSRGDWPDARLAELFQSSLGPLRRGVSDGYYLFQGGFVVGYHGTAFRPPSVSYAHDPDELATRERVAQSPAAVTLRESDREPLRQLVAYFEPIVERKQRAAGFTDDGSVRATREAQPPPPPPTPAAAPAPDDPYVVLGVAEGATDDEVRAAYKSQLKLNHPDKVAHLSPALQQFAQQQTLLLKHAYASIAVRRGWPRG